KTLYFRVRFAEGPPNASTLKTVKTLVDLASFAPNAKRQEMWSLSSKRILSRTGIGALSNQSGNRLRPRRMMKLFYYSGRTGLARNTWKPRRPAMARLFRMDIQICRDTVGQHTGCLSHRFLNRRPG